MKTVTIDDAVQTLAHYAEGDAIEPAVVVDGGRPVAMLIPLDDVDLETLSLSTNPDFLALLARSRRRLREEGGISIDEIRREFGIKPKSQRARRRA